MKYVVLAIFGFVLLTSSSVLSGTCGGCTFPVFGEIDGWKADCDCPSGFACSYSNRNVKIHDGGCNAGAMGICCSSTLDAYTYQHCTSHGCISEDEETVCPADVCIDQEDYVWTCTPTMDMCASHAHCGGGGFYRISSPAPGDTLPPGPTTGVKDGPITGGGGGTYQ